MPDKWQQYLRQQLELGGGEIYLAEAPAAPTTTTPAATPVAVAWQKGAPPIPGPGLTIDRPLANLLSRDLDHLVSLEGVAERVATCTLCGLSKGRKKTVPGEGSPTARLMLVGEGPGATEDETGRPFVGAAGELLTQILGSIGIPRESVFIANIVKCRPPQNRKPLPDESAACLPYLHRQVQLVRPKVLVALGATAAEGLLGVRQSLGQPARFGPQLLGHSAGRHVPPCRSAPQPELEEADLG